MTNNNPYILENGNASVDVTMLYDISGNDEDYINKMVQIFLERMPDNLEKIEQGIKSQDWESVYQSAHHTKSSLSIIKISDMFDWIKQVEDNAKYKTDLEILPELIKKIKEKFIFAKELLSDKFRTNYAAF